MDKNVRREDWQTLKPTVHGWGIIDVNYRVILTEEFPRVNGRRNQKTVWTCPYYQKWKLIIRRVLDPKWQERYPTYKGCTICEEWQYLSNFIKWVDSQPNRDWANCQLDKDFLFLDNKEYSPTSCVFITSKLNTFIVDSRASRGDYMIGVTHSPTRNAQRPFVSRCSNPFNETIEYLGSFETERQAHKAWQTRKHDYACMLAGMQEDERVAKALRERYAADKDWTNK